MKKGIFLRLLPHLIAIVIFLIVAVVYCKPALEGKVVVQSDITNWKGSIHQSEIYNETHGQYPLWTTSLFSGMPTFQIGGLGGNYVGYWWHNIITLGLSKPIAFFFLACLCFYFLSQVLRVRSYIGVLGALAFAYATYNPIIISVGHDTKMFSIAYMPAVIGSFILIYQRKFWTGAVLAALFTSAMISANHLQIVYYTFIVIGIMTIFSVIQWVNTKDWKTLGAAAGFSLLAFLVGVFTNSIVLFSTYEYQKQTIRGGPSTLSRNVKKEDATNGLSKDYAFSYSLQIPEPFVMLVPRMYGGSNDKPEMSQENSKAVEVLASLPQELQQQLPMTYYWGGLIDTGIGTSGPPYIGSIICLLAILSLFFLDNKNKWWALTAIVVSIIMSWGQFFDGLNSILYHYLPFYNKFRAPSMILVIPQVLLPMLAILGINGIANTENKKSLLPAFKKGLIATGAIFVLLLLLYASLDFLSKGDKSLLKQVQDANQPQLSETVRSFFDALKDDRKSLMLGDIFRSLGFIVAGVILVFLMLRNTLKPLAATIIITILAFIDVMAINTTYLNSESYKEVEENSLSFQKTKADEEIQADKSYYRVLNVSGNPFNENITSYFYNSVGGYHPAKLLIYQDLIEHQLSKQPMNEKVLDMLNTKYFIQKDQNGQTQAYQARTSALGPVWFVKGIRYVKNADEEMKALDYFTPKDTAIMQESFKGAVSEIASDSSASIELIKNENDLVTYKYQTKTNQFAVFSEVFYDKGWKASVNGKELPIAKVNYVLRGLSVPLGAGNIEFRFEPPGYLMGKTILNVFLFIFLVLFAGAIFFEYRNYKKPVL